MELAARLEARTALFAAPSFSVFKYIPTYEDDVTRILRDLLDPQGDHGQGALFLRAFLEQLGFAVSKPELGRATVRAQVRTSFDRRLDLLIDVPEWLVLGLENKNKAPDQNRQVADYAEFVRSRSQERDWAMAFLTADGRPPSAQSISVQDREEAEKRHRFFRLSYRKEILDWLQSCIGLCRAESVRSFVTGMSAWVETI